MTKLTGAALDRAVANALGIKSVHDCENWGEHMTTTTLRKAVEAFKLAHPRTWVSLTDAEAESAIDEIGGFAFGLDDGNVSNATVVLYAKAIEAKLREKNT